MEEGRTFDIALIDGWHTFDHVLLDFFYLNSLIKIQGIIVFDDVTWYSINRVLRYVSRYPNYQIIGSVPVKRHWKKHAVYAIKNSLGVLARLLPKRLAQELYDDSVLRTDASLELNSSMVALRKVALDERCLNWHMPF